MASWLFVSAGGVWESEMLHVCASVWQCQPLICAVLVWCVVGFHLGFNLQPPNDIKCLFLCPSPFLMPALLKCVLTSSAHFLWSCLFSYHHVFGVIMYSGYISYSRYLPCTYVLPVYNLPFESLNYGFRRAKVLSSDEVCISLVFMDRACSVCLRSLCLI